MVSNTRDIDEILNIEPVPNPKDNALVTKANNSLALVQESYNATFIADERFNEDFEDIRENIKDVILEVNDSIKKLSLIAQDSERASAFSALSQLVGTLLNANKQLLEIYSEKKKYHEKFAQTENKGGGDIHVQNAIFTGTTTDLDNYIRNLDNKKGSE